MVILMAEVIGIAQREARGSVEVFGKGRRYCGKGRRFKPKMGAMAYIIGYMFPMSPKVGELLLDGRFERRHQTKSIKGEESMDVPRPSSKIVGMTPVDLCLNVRDPDCDHEFHHDCDHDCDHVSRVM